jgi:enolase-phosphatase E1
MSQTKVYLLDVEGTVAPLTLTSEVLFPYARAHLAEFLWQSIAELEGEAVDGLRGIREDSLLWDVFQLQMENRNEMDPDAPKFFEAEVEREHTVSEHTVSMSPSVAVPRMLQYIHWLMDRDRKSTALKSLQGKIWKAGYESGELKGALFADVPAAFALWSKLGRVAIYSSGSVEAQRLLFRHSNFGDLTPMISGYFDTRTGAKMESASYAAIAREMAVAPADVLFFSDSVKELDAARAASCRTRLVIRPGNAPVDSPAGHAMIRTFDEAMEDDLAGEQDGRL